MFDKKAFTRAVEEVIEKHRDETEETDNLILAALKNIRDELRYEIENG